CTACGSVPCIWKPSCSNAAKCSPTTAKNTRAAKSRVRIRAPAAPDRSLDSPRGTMLAYAVSCTCVKGRGRVKPQFNVDARVHDIRVLVQDELDAVETFLESCCVASGVELIDEVWDHLLVSPGKRLRPLLLLLSARAHGAITEDTIMAGAVVEMIHTATLIHDDVVDKARVRRGQPTVNHRWHDGIALMMGDFLYSKSFQLFTAAGLQREMALLADTTNRM